MRISDWSSDVCSSDLIARKTVDQPVEDRRRYHLPQRKTLFEGFEIILEADELFAARRFVDTIHHRRFFRFERLRRRDIGRDHIILDQPVRVERSEEHTSELQSLMRISYAVFCLKKKKHKP